MARTLVMILVLAAMCGGHAGCSSNKVELDPTATVPYDKARDGKPQPGGGGIKGRKPVDN